MSSVSKQIDSLPELLNCVNIKYAVQGLSDVTQLSINQTKYEDIFPTVDKEIQPTETYTKLLKLRERLLDRAS